MSTRAGEAEPLEQAADLGCQPLTREEVLPHSRELCRVDGVQGGLEGQGLLLVGFVLVVRQAEPEAIPVHVGRVSPEVRGVGVGAEPGGQAGVAVLSEVAGRDLAGVRVFQGFPQQRPQGEVVHDLPLPGRFSVP
jgi:hypothetical protein